MEQLSLVPIGKPKEVVSFEEAGKYRMDEFFLERIRSSDGDIQYLLSADANCTGQNECEIKGIIIEKLTREKQSGTVEQRILKPINLKTGHAVDYAMTYDKILTLICINQ